MGTTVAVWRFQVSSVSGEEDALARRVLATLADFSVASVRRVKASRLYLIELPDDDSAPPRIARELLTDPVVETCRIARQGDKIADPPDGVAFEVFFKPGVMNNVADSTLAGIADMGINVRSVRTGLRYEFFPIPADHDLTRIPRLIANDCIQEVVRGAKPILPPPSPPQYRFELRHVEFRDLDDAGLARLSRDGHLFLSPDEMQAIQTHYRDQNRDPTDLELETLAQTWSEHCVHKTLKSAFVYRGAPMPGGDSSGEIEIRYDNLLRDTIAQATQELIAEKRGPECLSVFVDNAGIIGFDGDFGVAFKVETHNHPSAIEPYGGAATGVGGVIRDVLGCGLGARPVANTDVFCVAPPDWPVDSVPKGVIHPKTVLKGVVSGVRDYGNCMGIPTVNGAVHFDPRYLGNPLVYCGCVGLIPRDRVEKAARPGDAIVLLGGRTGRDGIHGATFSSAELTDTHEDEFSHAVQIGNPVEEKKVRDVVLLARDFDRRVKQPTRCLFSAITDCGAGGLSSAVGEMAEQTGAEVDLDRVPLKYTGLRYDEIWISEAQERMVLAVPQANVDALLQLASDEDVEATVIGRFTNTKRLIVRYDGKVVGDIDMGFLHQGLPKCEKQAEWRPPATEDPTRRDKTNTADGAHILERLKATLTDPIIASKHWIVRQYDHEVLAGSAVKPLTGTGEGPNDAAVVRPRLDSNRGVVIGCGLAPQVGDVDPYWMAIAAIDEAVRNCVCVGGDPRNMAILDNFCWPASDDPHSLGALVRACQACYDAAKAYGLPFISGKDSLNNVFAMNHDDARMVGRVVDENYPEASEQMRRQFERQPGKLGIPCTLLISAISVIDDVDACIRSSPGLAPDDWATVIYVRPQAEWWDAVRLDVQAALHARVAGLIAAGRVLAAHDVSDGGLLTALVEMAFGADHSLEVRQDAIAAALADRPLPGYLLVLRDADETVEPVPGVVVEPIARIGASSKPSESPATLTILPASGAAGEPKTIPIPGLRERWRAPLDW